MKKLFISYLLMVTSLASAQQDTGKQLAQDSMALISYLELGNIGSRDADCKGTLFEVTNINSVIETDVRATLTKLAAMENQNNPKEIERMLSMLKHITVVTKDGKSVALTTYEKLKQDNFTMYGKQAGCAALSATIRSVVQQRKQSINKFLNR